jgi:hypothetical protein
VVPAIGEQTGSGVKIRLIRPEFVVSFPPEMEEGVLYISEEYATAAHKCCCGCGEKVLTPLNPAKWRLTKSPAGVSLCPSIGNWKFACQSHYWIKENRVIDAGMMSKRRIEAVKVKDKRDNQRYIDQKNRAGETQVAHTESPAPRQVESSIVYLLVEKLRAWWRGS